MLSRVTYLFNNNAPKNPNHMPILKVVPAGITHPFGDDRSVLQAFPAAIPAAQADPFLMCDDFSTGGVSRGKSTDPDHFPVGWHPHRGMDILSYMKHGVGRHGDSMGNREEIETPGMQWIACGSGIEHAEGGGTPAGEKTGGFQIWINTPAARKMDDPRYGIEPPSSIPAVEVAPGATRRLLAGAEGEQTGPFQTTQQVQVVDFELGPGAALEYAVPAGLDTTMAYVYDGAGQVSGSDVAVKHIALLNSSEGQGRVLALTAGEGGMSVMLFAGKKLREPIAWRGPIVMNTQQQLRETFEEIRSGKFPPVRASWDYKRIATRPMDWQQQNAQPVPQ